MKKIQPTLLIAEDDPQYQVQMVQAFKKIGIHTPIHAVNNGQEAIDYMMGEGKFSDRTKYSYPTFIITGLHMPVADGFAVLSFLKGNPEWAVIPTIVFSNSQDLDDIKKSYMLGASSYHVKPRTHEGLVHQLLVLNAYWLTCEVPQVDSTGRRIHTESEGKLGERFAQEKDLHGQKESPKE
jgi:CheY-like chemotaxis protein